MDALRFDRLTRHLTSVLSRRRLAPVVAALGLAASGGFATEAGARKRKKPKPKKCKKGTVKCGKRCVNPRTNAQHCGGCGKTCSPNSACIDGACQGDDCATNQILCGELCVDPRDNEEHCGRCNNRCPDPLNCVNGQCVAYCDPPCRADRQCIEGRCTCQANWECANDPHGDWCVESVPGQPALAWCGCPESSDVCAAGERCSACCSAADCDTGVGEICTSVVNQPVRTCCIPNGSVCGYRNDFCCSQLADDIRHDARCVCAPPGAQCGTSVGCCSSVCQQATLTCA